MNFHSSDHTFCSMDLNEVKLYIEKYRDRIDEALRSRRFIELCTHSGNEHEICVYVFRGTKRDHLLIRCDYCSCHDYLLNVVSRKKKQLCYHLLGLEIAISKGLIVKVTVTRDVMYEILKEILLCDFSPTLRRVM